MYRLGHLVNGEWVEHSHHPVFQTGKRIVAGVPGGDPAVFAALVECLEPPFHLLYLLHTPRGEAQAGRYQSPLLSLEQVKGFVNRFSDFLRADARFDLWAHSPSENGTVVWDRHNRLFGYGPIEQFAATLSSMGFSPGQPDVPAPHEHHYRAEFDGLAKGLMAAFDWSYSPLRPQDEQ